MTPKAKEAIARFSQILNSATAAGCELMVAGHTDKVKGIGVVRNIIGPDLSTVYIVK